MKLLKEYLTASEAMTKSAALYPDISGAVTQYLVPWKQHPQTGKWALAVPQDYESLLPPSDRDALTDDDWPSPTFLE